VRTVIIALLLTCIPLRQARVFATERPISDGAVREATRLAQSDGIAAAQAVAPPRQRSSGHPVRNGALIGAGAGALLGALGTSCDPPGSANPVCGTRPWVAGALVGGGIGAGIGALIGLAFKR
jgi:hypothetical protein